MNGQIANNADHLMRGLDGEIENAKSDISTAIEWIRRQLDEAERRLAAGDMPNRCGILQGSGATLDMAVARYVSLCDLQPSVNAVTEAILYVR